MITFDHFSFRYAERSEFTLNDINLTVQTGEFILLTGRSGCGKTTLIRSLNGLIPHFYPGEIKGDVLLDGRSLLEVKPADLAGEVGSVFQDPRSQFFMTDTTRELAFGCENMGFSSEKTVERITKAAIDLKLTDYLNRSIFDEPSANLDYTATKRLAEIMKRLKQDGYTILVVEHRFYYLRELIDRAFLIEDGRLVRGFTGKQFCELPDQTRIQYGLRTVYPEHDVQKRRAKSFASGSGGLLTVKDLSFSYKDGTAVLENISFEAHGGDVIGIIGHNGAGKTTLLSVMTGLLKEEHGEIRYNGKKLTPRGRRKLSYLVMQDADYQLFSSSVEEELSLGMETDCDEKVTETLEALALGAYRKSHPAALSGGQKQRVTIGAAIVKGSPVIYFDEPTSGLDYDSMVRVSGLIEQLAQDGVIVFVVSHDFEFITRTCSEVLWLDRQDPVKNALIDWRSCYVQESI